MRCHWVKDNEVPDGRYFVPGCWGGVMGWSKFSCICQVDERDELVDLQKRVAKLEKQLEKSK